MYTGYYYSPTSLGAAGAASAAASGQAAVATIAASYTSGFIASGNLKSAVLGALTAGADYGIGSAFPDADTIGYNVSAHALAGGVLNELSGGNFGHGFVSAGLGAAIDPHIQEVVGHNPFVDGVAASIVGGRSSRATSGKFANGALSGAF